jgi:ribonuclease BN (tRNA processing enzyme)
MNCDILVHESTLDSTHTVQEAKTKGHSNTDMAVQFNLIKGQFCKKDKF